MRRQSLLGTPRTRAYNQIPTKERGVPNVKTSNRDGRVTFLPMRWTGGQLRAVLAAKPPQRIFRARVEPNFPQWMFRWTRGGPGGTPAQTGLRTISHVD